MDLITIAALGGIIIILVLVVGVGLFLVIRRRGATSAETTEKPKQKAKKPLKKMPSQGGSSRDGSTSRHQTNSKAPQTSANNSAPAAGRPAKKRSPSAFNNPVVAASAHPARLEESKAPPGEKIRILIVDDNEGTRENVTRLLYFEDDLEVVGQAMNGRQGVEMSIELKPHIVLMDINMPDMDGITATQEMGLKSPFSQVIIMSVQSDQHYMRRAMAAGARDFQPKPFTSEDLVSCIRRVYTIGLPMYRQLETAELAKATREISGPGASAGGDGSVTAPVIAVYSPKGGVGTSAIAGNLAIALQQEVGSTVLMDGVLQFGDIMVHLNTRATRTICDLVHDSSFEVDLLPDILLPHTSGLKLLLGPPSPELADAITPTGIVEVINNLKRQFKLVVIDTHSQLTDETLAALDNADYVLLVITPELPAIKNAKHFLELAELLELKLERIKVVINRANEPGGVPPKKVKEILALERAFYIPQDPRLDASLRKGVSVCLQDSSAPSAQAIKDMAHQLLDQLGEAIPDMVEEAV